MAITLRQAMQRAAVIERGGAAFYRDLSRRTEDERSRDLFEKLARDEEAHAEALELHPAVARQGQEDASLPDPELWSLEAAWSADLMEAASLRLDQAVTAALQAERHAELFYDMLARMTVGETSRFFTELAEIERSHTERLRWWWIELHGGQAPGEDEGQGGG